MSDRFAAHQGRQFVVRIVCDSDVNLAGWASSDDGQIGVVAALVRSAFLVNAVYAESGREHGLTPQQGQLLCVLMARPYGMSELGAILGLAKSSLTGLVDRTERNGLVRREPDPGDTRAVRVALTPRGSRLAEKFYAETCRRIEKLPAGAQPPPNAIRSPACSAASCWTTRFPLSSWNRTMEPAARRRWAAARCSAPLQFVARTNIVRATNSIDLCRGRGKHAATVPGREVVFGFGAHSAIDDGPELLRHGPAGRPGRARPLLAVGSSLPRRAPGRLRVHRLRPRADAAHRRPRQRHQPAHPARSHAGPDGDVAVGAVRRPHRARHGRGRAVGPDLRHGGAAAIARPMPSTPSRRRSSWSRCCRGGGPPVTYQGRYYQVDQIDPAPAAAPPVWTGSVGPKSLAATGRVADGWIPGHAADWLSDRYRASRPVIDEAAAAAGRDPGEVRTVFNLPGRITGSRWPPPATATAAGSAVRLISGSRN